MKWPPFFISYFDSSLNARLRGDKHNPRNWVFPTVKVKKPCAERSTCRSLVNVDRSSTTFKSHTWAKPEHIVLHKRGLCSRIAGWGGEKGGFGWWTDMLTGERSRRSTGNNVHKKHGTLMKNYVGWVGRMRSISTLLPSLWSILSPDVSISLTQPDILLNTPDPWRVYSNELPLKKCCTFYKRPPRPPPPHRGRSHSVGLSPSFHYANCVDKPIYIKASIFK